MKPQKFFMIMNFDANSINSDRFGTFDEAVRNAEMQMRRAPGTNYIVLEAVAVVSGKINLDVKNLN